MIKLSPLFIGLAGLALFAGDLPAFSGLLGPLLIIALLVALNGLFVAAEFALIGVRHTQLEQLANEGNRIAPKVLTILRSPARQEQYIATAQVGITIASLGLGMYGEPKIAHFIEPYLASLLGRAPHETLIVTVGYISAVGMLTYLHIVVGEMVPKSLALTSPDKTVLSIARIMEVMEKIFFLPVSFLNAIGRGILHLFRIPPAEGHARLHSPEELELIVTESAESGQLNQAEEQIIGNIFDFSRRRVHQVMTPRPRVQAISSDMPLPDMLKMVTESHYSRFPVYEHDLDHIIGIVHIKDLVHQHTRLKGAFDIRLLLRPVHLVPENYPVAKLLAAFKHRRRHMAVVLDEYGGAAGLVTLEDLIEEIVGEVRDEFDRETDSLVRVSPGVLEVSGSFLLDDLAEDVYLGEEDSLPNVETVGGLIMAKLGRVPQPNDTVECVAQVKFTVLAVDGLAVARARVEFTPPANTQLLPF
jgi:CBS domain containing-hemolysin-like protein